MSPRISTNGRAPGDIRRRDSGDLAFRPPRQTTFPVCNAIRHLSPRYAEAGELNLPDRREVKIRTRRVLADADDGIARKVIRRDWEVVRRRHTAKYASGQVIFRTMAGAKIATRPIGRRGSRVRLRFKERNASKMRAYADDDAELGFDRTMPIADVGRLLQLCRLGIGQPGQQRRILELLERVRRSMGDEDRSTSLPNNHLLPGRDALQIELNWSAGGQRCRVRIHLADEWDKGGCCPDGTEGSCCDVKEIAARGFAGRSIGCSSRRRFCDRFVHGGFSQFSQPARYWSS
jgi:hypothetical protein